MDSLLDELSMGSDFTCSSLRNTLHHQNRRSVRQILVALLEGTTPFEAAVIVQVILKDLRPLIYPIASNGTRSSLLDFKSNAIKPLEVTEAVWAWDPSGTFKRAYAVRATLDAAAEVFEIGHAKTEPIVGVSIKVKFVHVDHVGASVLT
jgi:DNA ligase-4